tara:strand:+ start:41 stop:253 length:213 start_codon:yes stop_codon:yes gene_type:complete
MSTISPNRSKLFTLNQAIAWCAADLARVIESPRIKAKHILYCAQALASATAEMAVELERQVTEQEALTAK